MRATEVFKAFLRLFLMQSFYYQSTEKPSSEVDPLDGCILGSIKIVGVTNRANYYSVTVDKRRD